MSGAIEPTAREASIFSPEAMEKSWLAALQLLRDRGADVDAMLRDATENVKRYCVGPPTGNPGGGVVTEEPLDRFLARLDLQSPPETLTGQRVLLGTDYDRLLRELAESRAKHARQAELNCALVSQNCKLIERNRDLGDVAPPWNPPEP